MNAQAGWTAMRFNENFDDEFPDWSEVDTIETADQGLERRKKLMDWGRKDTGTGAEWVEIWGLEEILTMFGFPDDPQRPVRTTVLRGFLEDN